MITDFAIVRLRKCDLAVSVSHLKDTEKKKNYCKDSGIDSLLMGCILYYIDNEKLGIVNKQLNTKCELSESSFIAFRKILLSCSGRAGIIELWANDMMELQSSGVI